MEIWERVARYIARDCLSDRKSVNRCKRGASRSWPSDWAEPVASCWRKPLRRRVEEREITAVGIRAVEKKDKGTSKVKICVERSD